MTALSATPGADRAVKAQGTGKINNGWIDATTFFASITDVTFAVVGNVDATKKLAVQADTQSTASTLTIDVGAQTTSRTLTVPVLTASATLATLSAQTFTAAQTISAGAAVSLTLIGPAATGGSSPDIRFRFTADNDAALGFACYDHDNVAMGYDAYFNGTNWVASHTSAMIVFKTAASLRIYGDAALTKGNTFTPTERVRIAAATGDLLIFSTTEATSPTAASASTAGGFGVSKRSYLGVIGATFKGNVLAGVQDATAVVAGQVGEVLTSTVTGVAVAATGTVGNVTSLSLTAGDWLISAHATISGGATGLTAGSAQKLSIVTTTATNGAEGDTMQVNSVLALLANGKHALSIPQIRINISSTTTYYLTEEVTFVAGSPTIAGKLIATRIR
jgi:hypothetical protein